MDDHGAKAQVPSSYERNNMDALDWLRKQDVEMDLAPVEGSDGAFFVMHLAHDVYQVPANVVDQGVSTTRQWLKTEAERRMLAKAESLEMAAAALRQAVAHGVVFQE